MYINIHTHQPTAPGEQPIRNLYRDFENTDQPGFFSVGIHPWYIQEEPAPILQQLALAATRQNVLAIGETGLDKLCGTAMDLQEKIFREQLRLAQRLQKPVIIHCVRAFAEVQSIIAQEQLTVPVIFHGYNKGGVLARQLVQKGYYLSFGQALGKEEMQAVLKTIPPQQFFLETDDAAIPVSRLYEWAAKAFSIEMKAVHLQIQQNAAKVFGPLFASNI